MPFDFFTRSNHSEESECYFLNCKAVLMYVLFLQRVRCVSFVFSVDISPGLVAQNGVQPA